MIYFKGSFIIALSLHFVVLIVAFYKQQLQTHVNSQAPISKNYIHFSLNQEKQEAQYGDKQKDKKLSSDRKSSTNHTEKFSSTHVTRPSIIENPFSATQTFDSSTEVPNFEEMVVNYREPVYPQMALVRGLEANLEVLIKVSKDGQVESIEFVKKSDYSFFNEATLDAIKLWKFKSKNFPYRISKIIIFKLR